MSRRVHSPGSFFLCDDGNEGIVAYGADGIYEHTPEYLYDMQEYGLQLHHVYYPLSGLFRLWWGAHETGFASAYVGKVSEVDEKGLSLTGETSDGLTCAGEIERPGHQSPQQRGPDRGQNHSVVLTWEWGRQRWCDELVQFLRNPI